MVFVAILLVDAEQVIVPVIVVVVVFVVMFLHIDTVWTRSVMSLPS